MPITLQIEQVSLTEHDEPCRRILAIHGLVREGKWQHTQAQAIDYVESGLFSYYLIKDGRAVRLVAGRTAAGEKFLKAETDGDIPALLLQLPSIMPPKTDESPLP